MAELVINDSNYRKFLPTKKQAGDRATGLVRRNFKVFPYGSIPYAGQFDMPLMTDEEIEAGIRLQAETESSLWHLRQRLGIQSLDQDGYGYCWAFSTVKAVMYLQALMNGTAEPLSGWAVGSIVKNYRNQGGWCQQSLEFAATVGVPSLKTWPQGQVRRDLDTPAMREDAGTRRVTEWMDMEPRNTRQLASNLLRNIPTMIDLNWQGHSVCAFQLVAWKPLLRVRIDNSWTPDWGDNGTAIYEGSRAVPDNQACPRWTKAA